MTTRIRKLCADFLVSGERYAVSGVGTPVGTTPDRDEWRRFNQLFAELRLEAPEDILEAARTLSLEVARFMATRNTEPTEEHRSASARAIGEKIRKLEDAYREKFPPPVP